MSPDAGKSSAGSDRFAAADGTELFYRWWMPERPSASVIIVHGGAEHSGRYEHVGRWFSDRKFAAYALDLRGLGQSGGRRGDVEKFEHYLDDLEAFARLIIEKHPGVPLFLFGHSIGGLLVLGCAARNPGIAKGAVASSPCLELSMKVPPLRLAIGKVLARIAPTVALDNGIPPEAISRDPEVVGAYVSDPLRYGKVTVRFFMELSRGMKLVMSMAGRLRTPVLIMQAGEDRLVSKEASRRFFDLIEFPDKEFKLWEGLYHELLNEPERDRVFAYLEGWLTRQLDALRKAQAHAG